jgi:hypothetical protein
MDDAMAVEHVGANLHRQPCISGTRFFDDDPPRWAGALGGEHSVRDARREFVMVHRDLRHPGLEPGPACS